METEYIEKQAAIDALHEAYEARNPTQNAIMDKATMVIFRLPPADVRPVKRGEWLREDSASNYLAFKCSVCGTGGRLYKFPFCSQCGADMRGGDAE